LCFGFGLFVLAREYDRPRWTSSRSAQRLLESWVRSPDLRGFTLVDFVDAWREASPSERPSHQTTLRYALANLGGELDRLYKRFPFLHVVWMDLTSPGVGSLARWASPQPYRSAGTQVQVRSRLSPPGEEPAVDLEIRYRVAPEFDDSLRSLETSYHRLLLALL